MQAPPPTVAPVVATALDSARNAFAGFETHVLANGLKVWFNRVPGFRDVSVSVIVPYGSDLDPPGKEQLAHFTEQVHPDGTMTFDYRLRPGIATSTNALRLMQLMGITPR